MREPLLRVENLNLMREGRRILQDVNLTVYPGEIHALLGLNGSGKSSLAYAVMGCHGYAPDSGNIWFQGKNINQLPLHERARLGITLAWQEPARFEGIPVGKYVGLGMPAPDRQKTIEALEAVALPSQKYGYRSVDKTLSGGERKRVELAAVYAMQPNFAILDEPDSGIDVLSLMDITRLIKKMAEAGSSVLLITHREELLSSADRASLICAGQVLFNGSAQEVRSYYGNRCRTHLESLGNQPWDVSQPDVQKALASNGSLRKD